ncbi:MAG: chemotaxis protein CheC [Oscillospiraceae bacterium]
MSLNNINDLNAMELDILKEIGNIGQGNAASSLSGMLNEKVNIAVPNIKILDFNEVVNFLGGPENIAIGLLVGLSESINGMMLCIMQEPFVKHIVKAMFDSDVDDIISLSEMEMSFVSEVGNILSASYVNAISSMTGLNIQISVPQISVDMVGAILSVPAVEFAQIGDKVLFIDDSFIVGDSEIQSNMILVPELKSLSTLFAGLGVEM